MACGLSQDVAREHDRRTDELHGVEAFAEPDPGDDESEDDLRTGLLYLRARDYDPKTGQFLTVDPALDSTPQPYAYTGNNPLQRTDPLGLHWLSDVGETITAVGAGALDGITGGASSMILGAMVPGYDCFIQKNNTAFQVGSVAAQVIEVVITVATVVATLGAAAPAAIAIAGAKMAVRAGMKVAATATKALVRETVMSMASATRRLLANDVGEAFLLGGSRMSTVRHYTTRDAAAQITKSGQIDVGAASQKIWLTTDRYVSGAEAQAKLALSRRPDGYFEVPLSRISNPSPSSRVGPMYTINRVVVLR